MNSAPRRRENICNAILRINMRAPRLFVVSQTRSEHLKHHSLSERIQRESPLFFIIHVISLGDLFVIRRKRGERVSRKSNNFFLQRQQLSAERFTYSRIHHLAIKITFVKSRRKCFFFIPPGASVSRSAIAHCSPFS